MCKWILPPWLSSSLPAFLCQIFRVYQICLLCFVEFDKYSQLKKWLEIERWGISQTFSIWNLLIWTKLRVIVLILILITAFLFLHSLKQCIYRYVWGSQQRTIIGWLLRCALNCEHLLCKEGCKEGSCLWGVLSLVTYRDLQQGEEHGQPWVSYQLFKSASSLKGNSPSPPDFWGSKAD